jgi:hypothetical protein
MYQEVMKGHRNSGKQASLTKLLTILINKKMNKETNKNSNPFMGDGMDLLELIDRGTFAYYFRESQKPRRRNKKQSKKRKINKNKYNN